VKSLRPVEVSAAEVTTEGLRFDRQYILIKPPANVTEMLVEHLTIKKIFRLCLFQPSIDDSWSKLTITHTTSFPSSSITLPLTPSPLSLLSSRSYKVNIFGTEALGVDMGQEAADFFSKHLEQDVRLLFIGGNGRREIPGAAYSPNDNMPRSLVAGDTLQQQRIRFADAAPLLVTSSVSEEDARSRLPKANRNEDVILRFRPNIHIDTEAELPPYDEDNWSILNIQTESGTVLVKCLFKTIRCLSLNVDMDRGVMAPRERQLYGLLARDRRVNDAFSRRFQVPLL
jgi:uncharacterized protein YcbX